MVDYALEAVRNESIAIGVSNVVVSRSRTQEEGQERKLILIRNISAAAASIITINMGLSATANTGIVLRQYESFTDSTDAGYKAYQGQINAICADANGTISILER